MKITIEEAATRLCIGVAATKRLCNSRTLRRIGDGVDDDSVRARGADRVLQIEREVKALLARRDEILEGLRHE